jgi:hypothetical protein
MLGGGLDGKQEYGSRGSGVPGSGSSRGTLQASTALDTNGKDDKEKYFNIFAG